MIKDIIDANESILPNTKQMEALKENFPSCFKKDGSFDIERFKEYLSDKLTISNEGYELKFLGKNYARLLASVDTTTVIVPDEEHNNKPENMNSKNVYISGDNLDGLKQLLKSYAKQVKCIYIDPPYNTGSDSFVYNDNFNFTAEELSVKLSIDEEQAKRILDLTKRGSASHSAWLMFMYPRLLLARDLLKDDGVIFISIDDNEQSNLKLICDDVFGEENFEGHVHWRRRSNQPNDKTKLIGLVAEHIMVYSRNSSKLKESGVGKIALTGDFSNPDNDLRGPWATKPWKSGSDQSGTRYSITTPTGVVLNEEWMGDESTYNALFNDNRIVFPKGGNGMPRKKYFRSEREAEGQCASNWWNHELYGNNQDASRELEKLFGFKNAFSNPKPVKLISTVISLANVKENDIVLDFFSGSATTAEAVFDYSMDLNCSFILVQLPENIDDLLTKATSSEKDKWNNIVEMLDKNNRPHTLDYIGFERIVRAAKRIKEKNLGTTVDLGFKHYILKEPKGLTLDKLEEFIPDDHGLFLNNDILSDFGLNTVLTTWLIRDGYGFNANVKEIDFEGYTGYYIDKHLYLISPDISKEAIAAIVDKYEVDGNFNAENVVLFGYSFVWTMLEELKINLARLKDTEKNLRINFDVRY
ncbi:site-specific DNA-methyltransferase [Thomasclavelia spiroformis]|uniref:site-specific DNA-methyltransferase n=1 Tax=Thomasclavelia spiroformis TaxID=29348 RepID=UPI0024B1AC8E|nr:site-specific DNA-methyltransferase [Thomasclavelia spiroformis]